MKKKLLCFGDSNTYGYNASALFGARFPEDVRWTGRLNGMPSWEVSEHGQNGREIPHSKREYSILNVILTRFSPCSLFIVMLGTNDLLLPPHPSLDTVQQRMGTLLQYLKMHPSIQENGSGILLISPPPFEIAEESGLERSNLSAKLGSIYQSLALQEDVLFADAGSWDIEKDFDGVHFSADGHRRFADCLDLFLKDHLSERNNVI